LEARAARLSGYVVVDFPTEVIRECMPLPPRCCLRLTGGAVVRAEVVGELVDASRLSSEEYDRLLGEVGKILRFATTSNPDDWCLVAL